MEIPRGLALLVGPDRTIRKLSGPPCLAAYVAEKNLDGKLAGNLRQLCGYDVRNDGWCSKTRGDHYLIDENVTWLWRPETTEYMPLFGSADKKLKQFASRTSITMSLSAFQRKLRSAQDIGGWRKRGAPTYLAALPDGTSVYGLKVRALPWHHGALAAYMLPVAVCSQDGMTIPAASPPADETTIVHEQHAPMHEPQASAFLPSRSRARACS